MRLPRTVADVLSSHVCLEVECIDRLYLNVYQPRSRRPSSGRFPGAYGCSGEYGASGPCSSTSRWWIVVCVNCGNHCPIRSRQSSAVRPGGGRPEGSWRPRRPAAPRRKTRLCPLTRLMKAYAKAVHAWPQAFDRLGRLESRLKIRIARLGVNTKQVLPRTACLDWQRFSARRQGVNLTWLLDTPRTLCDVRVFMEAAEPVSSSDRGLGVCWRGRR
jgi:hypothetical protein